MRDLNKRCPIIWRKRNFMGSESWKPICHMVGQTQFQKYHYRNQSYSTKQQHFFNLPSFSFKDFLRINSHIIQTQTNKMCIPPQGIRNNIYHKHASHRTTIVLNIVAPTYTYYIYCPFKFFNHNDKYLY